MSRIITTNDGNQYQKAGFVRTGAGIYAGSMASGVVTMATVPLSVNLLNKMKGMHKDVDTVTIKNALNTALNDSGAAAKGVKIVDFAGQSAPTAKEFFKDLIDKIMSGKAKPSDLNPKRILNKLSFNAIKSGNNAGFAPKYNKVFINTEKLGLSGFHEIGHSINKNMSGFWRVMQKLRTPGMIAAGLFGTIALFKRKKVEGEEPKNFIDKTTTFIKNNVGKLTLLAFAPMVAEELKASARGNKLAKQLLSPDLFKKVVKSNRLGAATYVLTAVGTALAYVAGSKVRDAITTPKPVDKTEN